MKVPVGEATEYVMFNHPKAPIYARGHLDEVKQEIDWVLELLAFHHEDVAEVVNDLKQWLDERVHELTR